MKKIKKLITLAMLIVLPFAITGCDDEENDEYKLNFISENNKVYYTITSQGKENIDLPEEPSRKGYTFGGWYLDESYTIAFTSESLLNKNLEGNLTIYAKWDAINYNITYHLDGGVNSNNNPSSYNINTNINLENPTKNEYTFLGWYRDENYTIPVTNINSEYKGDLNLYAKWSIYDYEIVYHLDGGLNSNNNPSGYNINNDEITLENLTRTAYDFLGWYSDASFTNKITSIPANSTGKIDVYAKWEAIFDYANGKIEGLTSYGQNKNIDDLVIPEKIDNVTIETIGVHAFYGNELKTVRIPASVSKIEGGAFYSDESLNIYYQGTLNEWLNIEMGSNVFNKDDLYIANQKVTDVTIPSTVKVINSNAFYGINVNKFNIHSEVTTIGKNAFLNSTSKDAGDIYYGGTIEKWLNIDKGQAIFGSKYNLYINSEKVSELVIPISVKELKDNALSGINVDTITIHAGVTSFGKYALDINEEIKIKYEGTLENWFNIDREENSIYNAKLMINNKVVTDIIVPESIVVIKDNALQGIKGIVSVTLHEDVSSIGANGLNNSANINVYYKGTIEEWVKLDIEENSINKGSYLYIENSLVQDLIIGEDTTQIKENVFGSFTFESVTIHTNVIQVGENAFMKDGEITIYCEVASKPDGWDDNWQIGNTVYFGDEW